MENKKDNPGVLIPPPLLYLAVFFASILIQEFLPINKEFFHTSASEVIGYAIILTGLFFILPAFSQFFRAKTSLITVKPATSLQTKGIYSVSRNPMYMGLLLFYIGLSFIFGNWWNLILLPVLLLVVQEYVIKREEKCLNRRFGQLYDYYKEKVRRWI